MSFYNSDKILKEDPFKYSDYRCIIPNTIKTSGKWFPYENVCPCDPSLSNVTGRGLTPCPFGIANSEVKKTNEVKVIEGYNGPNGYETRTIPVSQSYFDNSGSLYQNHTYEAPQLDPRPFVRIGYTWRT